MAIPPGPSLNTGIGTDAISIYNALVPKEGPKTVPTVLDFTATNDATVDFTLPYMQAKLSVVQTVWLDNSGNGYPVKITARGTQQTIEIPARSQACLPVISAARPVFDIYTAGVVTLTPSWLNVPLPIGVWGVSGASGSGATAPDTFTVATGGVAVTVFSPSPSGGGYITNPYATTESLFVDPVNTAGTTAPGTSGTTVELKPGQSYDVPPNAIVTVNALTSGHTFTAVGVG